MLAKKYRIRNTRDLKRIYGKGKFIAGQFVSIKYLFYGSHRDDFPRIVIVVSKKISNKATIRNKIKRQISAVLQSVIEKIPHNLQLIVSAKKIPDDFNRLKEELLDLLKRGNLI